MCSMNDDPSTYDFAREIKEAQFPTWEEELRALLGEDFEYPQLATPEDYEGVEFLEDCE